MSSFPSENFILSLLQSRQLYQFNYQHIEPIAMQEGLNSQELPSNEWIVMALKVGYAVFLNASRQKRIHQPELISKSSKSKPETIFLSSILFNTIKVLGIAKFFGPCLYPSKKYSIFVEDFGQGIV